MYTFEPIYKPPFVFITPHHTTLYNTPVQNNNRRHSVCVYWRLCQLCWLVLFTCLPACTMPHICGGTHTHRASKPPDKISWSNFIYVAIVQVMNTGTPFRLCNPPRYLTPNTHVYSHASKEGSQPASGPASTHACLHVRTFARERLWYNFKCSYKNACQLPFSRLIYDVNGMGWYAMVQNRNVLGY